MALSPESAPIARKPILRQLALAFVGATLGLIAIDVGVAWWDVAEGAEAEGALVRHPGLGWTNRPYFENDEFATRLDRFGMRNDPIPDDAPADEVRIAGFGASRLYGAGGAQQPWCWNFHLERDLIAAGHEPLRILNGGVMGYSVVQAARRAALCLEALDPDLVFVTLTTGAQMLLDVSSQKNVVRYGDAPDDLLPADLAAGLPELLWPSIAKAHSSLMGASGIYRRHRAGFQVAGERQAGLQRWLLSSAPRSVEIDALLAATLDELEHLRDACRARGAEFRVVVMPEIQQDSEEVWGRFLRDKQDVGAPPIGTPRHEPTQELIRLLDGRGLASFDLTAEVETMGTERSRYLVADEDFHWAEPGHVLFAAGLAERLTSSGLLDQLAERRAAKPRPRAYGTNPFAELEPSRP